MISQLLLLPILAILVAELCAVATAFRPNRRLSFALIGILLAHFAAPVIWFSIVVLCPPGVLAGEWEFGPVFTYGYFITIALEYALGGAAYLLWKRCAGRYRSAASP